MTEKTRERLGKYISRAIVAAVIIYLRVHYGH